MSNTNLKIRGSVSQKRKVKIVLLFSIWIFLGIISWSENVNAENGNKKLYLEAHFISENLVYVTKDPDNIIKNELSFYIKSSRNEEGVMPSEINTTVGESYLKIYFEYGDDYEHLASPQLATQINLSITNGYGNVVQVKQSEKEVSPSWKLTAKNASLFKGNGQKKIELKFENIVSNSKPGVTTMHIEYGKIPKYNDGFLDIDLIKKEPTPMQAQYGLQVDGTVVNKISNDVTLKESNNFSLPTEKAVKTYIDNRLPNGVVVMWSGDIGTVPPGWALCDGNNGTPDLRNSFVLGSGNKKVGEKGGQKEVELSIEQLPPHTHAVSASVDVYKQENVISVHGMFGKLEVSKKSQKPSSIIAKVTENAVGKREAHNNMPPYYVLAFIMKLPTH